MAQSSWKTKVVVFLCCPLTRGTSDDRPTDLAKAEWQPFLIHGLKSLPRREPRWYKCFSHYATAFVHSPTLQVLMECCGSMTLDRFVPDVPVSIECEASEFERTICSRVVWCKQFDLHVEAVEIVIVLQESGVLSF